jgi:hypothetical protein
MSQDTQDLGWSRELTRGSELPSHYDEVSRRENKMTQANFMSWTGSCAKCGKIRRVGHGLFCSNFLLGRATFPRAEMFGAGNVIGKQATTGFRDWTTRARQQTPPTWRLRPHPRWVDIYVAEMETTLWVSLLNATSVRFGMSVGDSQSSRTSVISSP